MDAFDLAIRQLSTSQLRRIAVQNKKNISQCVTRDDYANLLTATMSKQQRLTALKESILAGRTSMALFKMDAKKNVAFHKDFKGLASPVPAIVTVGKVGEIVKGLQHVQWTMTDGQATFLDQHLELRVEPEAIVVDTFFDPDSRLLQIRGNHTVSRKIAREWARLHNVVFETHVRAQGLADLDDVHNFCDSLDGCVRKCTGDRLESKGFLRVSGMRAPGVPDLRGTDDYDSFVKMVDMVESQIEFEHDGAAVVIGIGLQSRSIVFVTGVSEAVIDFVYDKLKSFLDL